MLSLVSAAAAAAAAALVLLADLLLVAVVVLVEVVDCFEESLAALLVVALATPLPSLSTLSTCVMPVQLPGPTLASLTLSTTDALEVVLMDAAALDFEPLLLVTFFEEEEEGAGGGGVASSVAGGGGGGVASSVAGVGGGGVASSVSPFLTSTSLLSLVLPSLPATAAVTVLAVVALVTEVVVVGLVLVGATLSAVGGSRGMVALVTLLASMVLMEAVADLPRDRMGREWVEDGGESMNERFAEVIRQ